MVNPIVEVIEPFHGRLFDPANGGGNMFVSSARFVANHRKNPGSEISIFGQECVAETIRLCKMNLAVHGLSGDIRQSNTYYEDVHDCVSRFDFVMANPPFNVSGVDKEKLKDDPRFRLGLPSTDNANYLWIQIFYHALSPKGRAGFVMANSAAARSRVRTGNPQEADPVRRGGRDRVRRAELFLHGHAARDALVHGPSEKQLVHHHPPLRVTLSQWERAGVRLWLTRTPSCSLTHAIFIAK
jgi:hypothetical protein